MTSKRYSYRDASFEAPGEAAFAFRMGWPVTILTWEDGRSELLSGTVQSIMDDIADRLEEDGISARWNLRPATALDVQRESD